MKVKVEMPSVSSCAATQCAYNQNHKCHARAITVGDAQSPGCDTYFGAKAHSKDVTRVAGVGACKIEQCQYNRDYECSAESIEVGLLQGNVRCLTFSNKVVKSA